MMDEPATHQNIQRWLRRQIDLIECAPGEGGYSKRRARGEVLGIACRMHEALSSYYKSTSYHYTKLTQLFDTVGSSPHGST